MIFVACERVTLDQDDNSASLIGILQGFEITKVEKGGESRVPKEAIPVTDIKKLPIRWSVFSLWRRLPEDEDK